LEWSIFWTPIFFDGLTWGLTIPTKCANIAKAWHSYRRCCFAVTRTLTTALTSGSGSRTTTTSGRDDQDDKDEGRVSVPGEMCQARRLELHNQAGSGKSMAGGQVFPAQR